MNEELKDFLARKDKEREPRPIQTYTPPPPNNTPAILWFAFGILFLLTLLYLFGAFTSTPPQPTASTTICPVRICLYPTEEWSERIPTGSGLGWTRSDSPGTVFEIRPDGDNSRTKTWINGGEARFGKGSYIQVRLKSGPTAVMYIDTPAKIDALKATKPSTTNTIGPVTIGTKPVRVDAGNGNCIYRAQGRDQIKLVRTDGSKKDSRFFWYVSTTGKPVEATFTLYPITDPACNAVK